jgi:hypothetical protein
VRLTQRPGYENSDEGDDANLRHARWGVARDGATAAAHARLGLMFCSQKNEG